MMVTTPSIRELSSQQQKAKRQAKLIWPPPLLVVIKEVAAATKSDHASKVNIATTPSSREGTGTAVKNDQPATYIWSKGLLQERIKGQRRHSPYTPYSIGNSSRVIFSPALRPQDPRGIRQQPITLRECAPRG